jgi:hypothetical protein
LKKAEANLQAAGITTAFGDPGELTKPENLVPDPSKLGSPEKQKNLEESIVQLNTVLSEIEQEAEASPSITVSNTAPIGSISDRGLVHFYLGLAYLYDAMSRLLISDDPAETFIIKYDLNAPSGEWFTFDISKAVKAKLDATKNPQDYPLAFTEKERQAIIDAVDLISGAAVKPTAQNIQPQTSSVDRPPYLWSAVWHFERAIELFGQYNSEIKKALEDFNDQIYEFESIIKNDVGTWGFTYTPAQWR